MASFYKRKTPSSVCLWLCKLVCHFLFFEIFCLTVNLKLFVNSQGQQPVEFNHAINYVNKIKVNTNPLVYSILTLSLFTCFERNNLSY